MSNRRTIEDVLMLDSSGTTTGAGSTIDVKDFEHVVVYLSMASGTATVKIQGSPMGDKSSLDFDSAQSASNRWDYVEVIDIESGSAIDGTTGISTAGSTQERLVQLNTDGLSHVTANATGHDGSSVIKAYLSAYTDQ